MGGNLQGPEDGAAVYLSETFATLAANPELHAALQKRQAIPAVVLLLSAGVLQQVRRPAFRGPMTGPMELGLSTRGGGGGVTVAPTSEVALASFYRQTISLSSVRGDSISYINPLRRPAWGMRISWPRQLPSTLGSKPVSLNFK